jgi:hypothetical protein
MDNNRMANIGETDKRILQYRILSGEIKQESLDAYLKSLPDASENAKEVAIPKEARKRRSANPGGSADAD